MGNIMAPSYSGIFMDDLKNRRIKMEDDKIKLWIHYIDESL